MTDSESERTKLSDVIDPVLLAKIAPRTKLTQKVLQRLRDYEDSSHVLGFYDEQVWTLLFTYGFVADRSEAGYCALASVMTCDQEHLARDVWLEMLPLPCRQGVSGESEGNSEIDLVMGDIAKRQDTVSGVGYRAPESEAGWVCLVEAKWLSDISHMTTHDWERNQLTRVIETALTFQGGGTAPDRVHVALLTPSVFKSDRGKSGSRFYAYKWHEYTNEDDVANITTIRHDIERSQIECRASTPEWSYPDLDQRLSRLSLHWITYEDLLVAMPDSEFKQSLLQFIAREPKPLLQLGGVL